MLKIVKYLKQTLENSYVLHLNKNIYKHCHYYKQHNPRSLQVIIKNFSTNPEFVTNPKTTANSNISDEEKKLRILQLELDVARQEGRNVPDPKFMKDEQWKHLLSLNTRSARSRFYIFLWKLEKKKENKQLKKIKKQVELRLRKEKEKLEVDNSNHIIYGLMHTNLFLRIYETTMNLWHNNKLIQAMQFGQKLVFDCSYDPYMTKREAINTAKQLMLCFADNRAHNEPFDLHFCNTDLQGTTIKYLTKHMPTLLEPSFPLNVHEECFTELFPKDKLVYLTPHCKNELKQFNPDDVYIVGALVDKVNSEPLSLAKAKRLGLRMACLPLDRYLQWGSGSGKSLTLNQMSNILLDLKTTSDWNYSLRHVPRRKITQNEDSREADIGKIRVIKRSVRPKVRNSFEFDIDKWMIKKSS